ncbi:minor capsid protein [Latilactobacillus curvatus]|uniref:minor capsid protein n=1 Tax=Latilactobacillus curvatus TaxID=28038 RepID=UPI001C85EBC6|nr:minor capsid protein [Latilactobacillus curvatus]
MKVKVDLSGVRRKLSPTNFKRGQFAMANQAMADMNAFVPKREGDLRNSAHIDSGGQFVVWETPYAKRQFYGIGIHNYTTPGTGPRWDLKAKGMYLNSWVDAFKKGAKL